MWEFFKCIDALYPHSRERFGAPFGVLSGEETQGMSWILVGIRSLQFYKESVRVWTGAGILKESIFENEWQELNLKKEAVLKRWCINDK